ncbi:acetyl/propionyl/methylcrotonyl-CoA carboxylase subunit alpha [Pseudomonas sp. KNUC1026]|uniref:acetyl/propionyl/methylcrotonyl-CoA carboxylase subunit alpha n=1 Tax=Pseudomonas sp. KNUC1026 TaxID=2893890 RepID=UPI001F26D100|nr:acetyl/propionyl/methylcrotonyl-CoA carboxylase subunit alpha [Pseudomonas sp. KNUC1026]UFH51516.1 acetyl/propionyl/methylcrotonyl-CoA carboxylase subunit alpha [Pseudomonas sp. KNUC1026]
MKIQTLLVANRGEIACRIIRSARAMGIDSVAVYSDIDADALHVELADRAISLGGSRPEGSYLSADKVLAAAHASGAQAVHPGYGFLSENAAFARAVEAAGLLFIGPPASAIDAMGSKSAAKALMEKAQVPLVPGYHGEDQRLEAFAEAAERIGYPVLLKAAAGGGGKGMKVVEHSGQLAEALASAQREAQAAFGDARMLVEKYLLGPRHVEIQVFADQHGHCLYLHERDCSIQRRHQKVVEEAPAPGLSPGLRQAMGEAAVKAAQAIGYAGAGTVEFLLDERGEFFFMEMNTRLQVEHPVTEAITGLDLVAWQLRVAQGEPLPITQAEVPLNGHAIEVRLYAEDTERGFLPASGTLRLYREPVAGDGRRVDSGVREGDEVSPFYDPMLAKVIAWGEDREQARLRLLAMLGEMAVGGFASNLGFLRRVLAHPAFAAAQVDTGFIARHEPQLLAGGQALPDDFWALAAEAWFSQAMVAATCNPWAEHNGWRLNGPAQRTLALRSGEHTRQVRLSGPPRAVLQGERMCWRKDEARQPCRVFVRGASLFLEWNGDFHELRQAPPEEGGHQAAAGGLAAPMNASVAAVLASAGDAVQAGATLLVLEAMKMEHPIRAPHAGTVSQVHCREGDLVAEGHVLVSLEPSP